ncbi:MAG TPA: site-2 protease family protein [Woeseiaceae bacterium]|nr:site-2 protease family protein [Woeseiaceae bacterium]
MSARTAAAGRAPVRGQLHLVRLAGVDVYLDWSLLIIFFLISTSLASGLFPAWHPEWSAATSWLTALAAAALFLLSVLTHEMSHALVGRARGMSIRRITLFIFGGMAHLEEDPHDWRTELYMAAVGPLTSLVLGFLFIWLGSFSVGPLPDGPMQPEEIVRQLSPWGTLLLWLGPVNIVLGLFNLVPGFPLDGGRVMRAAIWGATGDLHKATRLASYAGRAFAWLLIAAGVAMILGMQVPLFGRGFVGGLWLTLIGWFLHNAALMSYRQLLLHSALKGVPVERLMLSGVRTVEPDVTLQAFVDDYVMGHEQRAWPVLEGGRFRGIASLSDVRKRARDSWSQSHVRDVMTPAEAVLTVRPQDESERALLLIAQRGVNQLPVMDGERLVGLVRREDILRWLSLHESAFEDGPRRDPL